MSAESNSSRSDSIESSDEFQMTKTGNSDINEEMLNLSVVEEVSEGITLMMSVHEAGNEDNMSELEGTNEDLVSVSSEEYAFPVLMTVKKDKDMK